MKMLIYCTKAKPYLSVEYQQPSMFEPIGSWNVFTANREKECGIIVNGKVVAECDFEVEQIDELGVCPGMYQEELLALSCLTQEQLMQYLNGKGGYAIRIKNLKTYKVLCPLDFYFTKKFKKVKVPFPPTGQLMNAVQCTHKPLKRAPQNMMYCYGKNTGDKYVLVSIRSQWVEKILNGEKTIEVRKQILKDMNK